MLFYQATFVPAFGGIGTPRPPGIGTALVVRFAAQENIGRIVVRYPLEWIFHYEL
ncbi:MAG: hypothetical protein IPI91_16415 [Flavobacteriales bacterium]|nr:hypothetical protein [Flavobacteriales bacterium]